MTEEYQLCCNAISSNDIATLRRLLQQHPTVLRDRDPIGRTLLLAACSATKAVVNPQVVKALLMAGASALDVDGTKSSALHLIVLSNKPGFPQPVRVVGQLLIQGGLHVDAQDSYGNTALTQAVFTWKQGMTYEAVDSLLDFGADPSLKNHTGVSPLSLAMTMAGGAALAAHINDRAGGRPKKIPH